MMRDLFSVRGKTALVTGGTTGIGRMMTGGLVAAGAEVIIVARTQGNCEAAVNELTQEGAIDFVATDIVTDEGRGLIAERLAGRPLDILVNCAGILHSEPLESFAETDFDRAIALNLKAGFFLVQALLPNLRAAARPDNPACIVNVTSGHGIRVPNFDNYAYTASKAALNHLTRHLAASLAPDDITVNAIAPGLFPSVNTQDFSSEKIARIAEGIPRGRLGASDDIIGPLLFFASRAGAYVTGTVLPVDGGWAGCS